MKTDGTDREAILPCADAAEERLLSLVVSGLAREWKSGRMGGGKGMTLALRARWNDVSRDEGEKIERELLAGWEAGMRKNRVLDEGCTFYLPLVHCREPGSFEIIFFLFIQQHALPAVRAGAADEVYDLAGELVGAEPNEIDCRAVGVDGDWEYIPAGRYQFPRRGPVPLALPAGAEDVFLRLVDEAEEEVEQDRCFQALFK